MNKTFFYVGEWNWVFWEWKQKKGFHRYPCHMISPLSFIQSKWMLEPFIQWKYTFDRQQCRCYGISCLVALENGVIVDVCHDFEVYYVKLHGRNIISHLLLMSDGLCCHSRAHFLVKITHDIQSLVIFTKKCALSWQQKNCHSLQPMQDPVYQVSNFNCKNNQRNRGLTNIYI